MSCICNNNSRRRGRRRWHGCVVGGLLRRRHHGLESLPWLHLQGTRRRTHSFSCKSRDVCIHQQLYYAHADTQSIRNLASQQSITHVMGSYGKSHMGTLICRVKWLWNYNAWICRALSWSYNDKNVFGNNAIGRPHHAVDQRRGWQKQRHVLHTLVSYDLSLRIQVYSHAYYRTL